MGQPTIWRRLVLSKRAYAIGYHSSRRSSMEERQKSSASLQDIQALLSEIQTLRSSTRVIDEKASQIARQLSSVDPFPDPIKPRNSLPLDRTRPAFVPEQIHNLAQSQPAPIRNPTATESTTEPQSQEYQGCLLRLCNSRRRPHPSRIMRSGLVWRER